MSGSYTNRWIPTTMLRTMYSNDKNMYISRFYIRFSEALDSVASVKLLNEAKSPLKFYKITFDRKKVGGFGYIVRTENERQIDHFESLH